MIILTLPFAAVVVYYMIRAAADYFGIQKDDAHPASVQLNKGNYTGSAAWEVVVLILVVAGAWLLFCRGTVP